MANRTIWPNEVVDRVDDLICAGIPPSEIRRRLREGEAGLKQRYEMPESSFFAIRRRLQKQRGSHKDRVPEGAELSTVEALQRRSISLMAKELSRLEALQQERSLTRDETSNLTQLARAIPGLRRQMRELDQATEMGRKGSVTKNGNSLLDRLRSTGSEGRSPGGMDSASYAQARTSRELTPA